MKIRSAAASRVAQELLVRGASTAADLAANLALTGTAVRRHLDQLSAAGLVQSRERAPYGPAARIGTRGRGRPARVYVLTEAGRTEFGQRQESLALAAVRHIAAVEGETGVANFARALSAEFAARHAQAIGRASDPTAALAKALSQDGYVATKEASRPGFAQLCQHNCPMGDIAAEFPVFCDEELAAFSNLVGAHLTRLATLAKGDAVCTTLVPLPQRKAK